MNWVLTLHPKVWDDVNEALNYYAEVQTDLPEHFIAELDAAFDFMRLYPLAGRPILSRFRRIALRRFPYLVCYRVTDHAVRVLAVVHSRRDPQWIRTRLSSVKDDQLDELGWG